MKNWGSIFTFTVAALLVGGGIFVGLKTQSLQGVVVGGLLVAVSGYVGFRYWQGKRS